MIHNPATWRDAFPDQMIPEIMELVLVSWESLSKPDSSEHEEQINIRFVKHMQRQKRHLFDNPRFNVYPEHAIHDSEDKVLGRIDIFFQSGWKEEIYFAFECKRLRIHLGPSKVDTNITKYADKGIKRFLTEQYSKDLPSGGMIGYVLDGNILEARKTLNKHVQNNKDKLMIMAGLQPAQFFPSRIDETQHRIGQRPFSLYHLLLGC